MLCCLLCVCINYTCNSIIKKLRSRYIHQSHVVICNTIIALLPSLSLFPKANVHRAFNIFAIVPRKTILIIISHDVYSMTKARKQNQKFHKTMVDKINVESVFCGSV